MTPFEQSMRMWPMGMRVRSTLDDFTGTVQGYYLTREGKPGLVIQFDNKRFVHVYGENWIVQEKRMVVDDETPRRNLLERGIAQAREVLKGSEKKQ